MNVILSEYFGNVIEKYKYFCFCFRCFLFDIDQVYDEYSSIKSLRVGADGDISLGFLSLGQITHYHE